MILSGLRVHGKDISNAAEKQNQAKFETWKCAEEAKYKMSGDFAK